MDQTTAAPSIGDLKGVALLNHPAHNKGTAFTVDERRRFGLERLLPQAVDSLAQVERPQAIRPWIEGQLYQPQY